MPSFTNSPFPTFTAWIFLIAILLNTTPVNAAAYESIGEPMQLVDWLLLPKVSKDVRKSFLPDPVTHALVHGTWQAPKVGDSVPLEEGKQAVWVAATAPDDGALESELLLGGWAYTKVFSADTRRAILRAKGHIIAYVNGEPRVTDVYRTGYVMIPVLLQPGNNHFLFRCVRFGTIEARLEPATHDLMLNMGDATLPEAIRGESSEFDAGIVVINTTTEALDVSAAQGVPANGSLALPSCWMPPLSIAKLRVTLPAKPANGDTVSYEISGERISPATVELAVVEPDVYRNVTFISDVEGSVQYFGFRPQREPNDGSPPALMLHLHGAGDQAYGYRTKYYPKTWCAMASATNRRPYGFSWENWGRLDALEVLEQATAIAQPDPSRIYLGGHSMGGHGVWIIAGQYPDRFAAIGPGAGWQDYWTYAGLYDYPDPNPVQQLLSTAKNPGRTALYANNYKQLGVMMIHGDADNVVSIEEAYALRDIIEEANHDDWTMVIEPGGGHVYDTTQEVGYSCFDSLDLFEFFQRHAIPLAPQRLDFTTTSPAVSATNHWLTIEQQVRQREPSRAQIQLDPGRAVLFGELENVQRFSIDPSVLLAPEVGGLVFQFDADGEEAAFLDGGLLHFELGENGWQIAKPLSAASKNPNRSGSVKTILQGHRPLLVVGTHGTPEENTWALNKARYDNETMWYRGNSSFEMVLDVDFNPALEPDRNVLLYGNADTNSAWDVLLADSPIQVTREYVSVGEAPFDGDNLACVFIRPRAGSDIASVAAIAGTGKFGMNALNEPSLLYAVAYEPDFTVFSADYTQVSDAAVLATGFFGNDWSLENGQLAFAE